MRSEMYDLCFAAILARKPLVLLYRGRRREVCPHVLGHTKGREMLLGYQFAGETGSVLPPGGEWRCFELAQVEVAEIDDGAWHSGSSHTRSHSCVADIDLDVNPDAPQRSWARHPRRA